MLKNKTLQFQFFILIIVNVIFYISLGIISFLQIRKLSEDIEQLGKESIPSIEYIYQIQLNLFTHRRALLALGHSFIDKKTIEYQLELIEKGVENIGESLKKYDAIPRTEEEDKLYKKVVETRKRHLNILFKYRDLAKKTLTIEDPEEKEKLHKTIAIAAIEGEYNQIFTEFNNSLQELVNYINKYYGETLVNQSLDNAKNSNFFIILINILGLGLVISISFFILNRISKNLKITLTDLTKASMQIESAANQVSASSQQLSTHANESASSIEEITSSMEELQSIIDSNVKTINEGKILMQETNTIANQSKKNSEDLLEAMQAIIENSKKINKINKVIEDIAFQTNILALNAAVEAARAGDAGRGFAVVAEQVKSLAQKSSESSKETNDLILEILESVEKGNQQVHLNKESIHKVTEFSNKVLVLLEEINLAFKEQAKGAKQVSSAITQINQSIQQVASSSEENASMGEELQSQILYITEIIQRLQQMIDRKKTENPLETTNKENKKISTNETTNPKQIQKENTIQTNKKIEIIKPEEKIPLEDLDLKDFKDF